MWNIIFIWSFIHLCKTRRPNKWYNSCLFLLSILFPHYHRILLLILVFKKVPFLLYVFSFYFMRWSGNTFSHFNFSTLPRGYCVRPPPPSCVNINSVSFSIPGLLLRTEIELARPRTYIAFATVSYITYRECYSAKNVVSLKCYF